MAREARNLSAGCYHDGIAWIKMLWPVRQLGFACDCQCVILAACCLFDDHDML